jgi:membrane-bound lytic murein transglycosylase F
MAKYFQYYAAIVLIGITILVSACSTDEEKNPQPDDGLGVTVTDPITRDFEQIKESGTLRMITRYSSNTYFLNQGLEWGFEYELVKEFAKTHDLTLDVIVVEPEQNPYDMLNNGTGDVIAANYTITPARKQYVAFTQPYNLVEQILIFSDVLKNPPSSVDEMAERNIPITVRSNSSYYQRLQNLQQAGIGVDIQLEPNKKDTESLLFEVAQGQHLATVADDNIFQAADIYMNGLMKGPTIAQNDTIAWAVRKNADELKKQMNAFLNQHFRFAEAGERPKRSGFLNVLRRRYFEGGSQVAGYYEPESRTSKSGVISPYDELFKKVADSAGVDWLMLAAITAKETQFKAGAKSWTGAMGLMQILPRYSEVKETKMLYDAETNVREGVRIITEHLNHYAYMDSTNQWRFALAAYNAGQGHVADARRLAIDSNKNPNEWQHTADALIKLMDRAYYKNARYGFCRGIETVNYVQDIMNRYRTYQSILMMAKDNEENARPGVLGIFN